MKIDPDRCKNCKLCLEYCPVKAIYMVDQMTTIDRDECVECFNCYRSGVCPVGAIMPEELQWPRNIRRALSDPQTIDQITEISGRGTAEIKTNDLTNKIIFPFIGLGVELGRPNLGTRFFDVEKVAMVMARNGVAFEDENPVSMLMTDKGTGKLREEILNEKVLSAIVEGTIRVELLGKLLADLNQVFLEVKTVVTLGLSCRPNKDGRLPVEDVLADYGMSASRSGKVNVGLGRRWR